VICGLFAGWVPKKVIAGRDSKIYILDFFGSQKMRGSGLNIHPSRMLTAFGSPWNSFLGFYIKDADVKRDVAPVKKLQRGIIWGKDPKHFEGKEGALRRVAAKCELVSTSTRQIFQHENVRWQGHKSKEEWHQLLASSKFLLGLGDPLLGPSAIDAIANGCVYINPIYRSPVRDVFESQHPYADKKIGHPHVCSYHVGNDDELLKCVDFALNTELSPYLPPDFLWPNYLERVKTLFSL
jgi:hypothetical protein